MYLECGAPLQHCPFQFKQCCLLGISGVGLCVLVFCRLPERWFCHNFVELRYRGMEDKCGVVFFFGELCSKMWIVDVFQ